MGASHLYEQNSFLLRGYEVSNRCFLLPRGNCSRVPPLSSLVVVAHPELSQRAASGELYRSSECRGRTRRIRGRTGRRARQGSSRGWRAATAGYAARSGAWRVTGVSFPLPVGRCAAPLVVREPRRTACLVAMTVGNRAAAVVEGERIRGWSVYTTRDRNALPGAAARSTGHSNSHLDPV